MIGIICPCRQEFEPFLKFIREKKTVNNNKFEFYTGNINNCNVVLCCSGIGKVNAAVAAQKMIDVFDADKIIVSGTAGSVDSRVDILDTVICETAVYHDFKARFLKTENPHMQDGIFRADKSMTENIAYKDRLYGCIATGDQFIDEHNRESVISRFNPLCIDMETVAVAHCCYMNDIPFTAVRTITDTPECSGIENCIKNFEKAACKSADTVVEIILNADI